MTIIDYLDITAGSVIAVVGCGGKTSLINCIAYKCRDKKVLISPTTKMFPIGMNDVALCETLEQCAGHKPQTGIQCFGLHNNASGKLGALPKNFLAEIVPSYDLTLLEADGSKGLPCKGWLANEPVIPPYCTHTVGVIVMQPLNTPATKTVVHRLSEFLTLTGLKEGQAITMQALEAMVCDPCGMFKDREWGVGSNEQRTMSNEQRRYLLVNQVEDEGTACVASNFLKGIREKYPGRFKRLLYGSVHLDKWTEA